MVVVRTAKAYAAFDGRTEVTDEDVGRVVGMCLGHRTRKDPLDPLGGVQKVNAVFKRIFADGLTYEDVYQELIVPLRKQSGGAKAEQGGAKKKATGPVVKPVAEVSSAEKAQAAQKKKEAVVAPPPEAVFFGQWTEEEDELVLFQQSDQGRALSISYEDAAACLGRTSNAVKCRWHSQVKGKVETMSSEEYTLRLERGARRWFQFRKQG